MKNKELLKIIENEFENDFFITTMMWPKICLERGLGENGTVSIDAYQREGIYHLDTVVFKTIRPPKGEVHLDEFETVDDLIKEIKKWLNYCKNNYRKYN